MDQTCLSSTIHSRSIRRRSGELRAKSTPCLCHDPSGRYIILSLGNIVVNNVLEGIRCHMNARTQCFPAEPHCLHCLAFFLIVHRDAISSLLQTHLAIYVIHQTRPSPSTAPWSSSNDHITMGGLTGIRKIFYKWALGTHDPVTRLTVTVLLLIGANQCRLGTPPQEKWPSYLGPCQSYSDPYVFLFPLYQVYISGSFVFTK